MNVGSLYISSKGRNWLIFLDSNYMFGCRIFTDQVPHSTRWRRTLNAAKPPETSYTTLPFSVMFLACWLCRSIRHLLPCLMTQCSRWVVPSSYVCSQMLLRSTRPWMLLDQPDEFLFQSTTPPWDKSVLGWPQSNADIFNLDSHAIHDIILPLHMRYPCQSHYTRISIIVTHASLQWFRSSSTCASLGQELSGCTTLVRLHSRWPWSSTGSVFSWTPHPQLLFHFA